MATLAVRPRWALLAAAAVAIAAALVVFSAMRPEPVQLAAALSLTGSGDFYGVPALDGARLAVAEANEEQGEAPVRLAVSDDHSRVDEAVTLARRIADSDALAVVGPALTVNALAAGPAYAAAGLVAIPPTAHGDTVPAAATMFQPIFNTSAMGSALAEYLKYVLHGKAATVLFRHDGYGTGFAAGFTQTAARIGLDADAHGFSTAAERDDAWHRAAADPRHPAVALGVLSDDAVPLLTGLRRGGVEAPILGPDAIGGDSFAALFSHEPEEREHRGFFTRTLYAASPLLLDSADDSALQFAQRFRNRYGHDPSWAAVQGYDATRLAITAARHALASTGPNGGMVAARREAARAWLASLNGPAHAIAGVTGPLWFTAGRGREQPVRIGRFQDGLFESASVQLVPALSFTPGELESGAVIDLGGGDYKRRQVVVAIGVLLNEISQLDFKASQFTADLYIWLRYAETPGLDSARPDDLTSPEIVNATSAAPKPIRSADLPDGTHYRLWRLRADFRNDFDFRHFPTDRQTLVMRFLNAHADSRTVVYVQDRRAAPVRDSGGGTATSEVADTRAFEQLPQWDPLFAQTTRQTMVTQSGLGNPYLIGLNQVRELSGFEIKVGLRRHVLTTLLKNLLPLVLMTAIAYSTLHFPPHLLKEKVTVTVTSALAGAVLLSSINTQLGGIGYIMAVEYIFYIFFTLCLLCIISFVITENLRAAKAVSRLSRVETGSRVAYLGIACTTIIAAAVIGARWAS